jgi:hypothetical protein
MFVPNDLSEISVLWLKREQEKRDDFERLAKTYK